MDRLTGAAELLDGPLDDPATLTANLRDLARINRLSGGTRLSMGAIDALGDATAILDVGTGGADIPLALVAAATAAGRPLTVTAVDSRPEILAAARRAHPSIDRTPGLELGLADGRGLPFPDGAFDIAHASLVLHHLEPDAAVEFLRELRRVARSGIVVNDLIRGRLFWLGGWLLIHATATSSYTRHDGPLSVRRSYSRRELRTLIDEAGLTLVREFVGVAGHRVAIAAR